MSLYHQIVEKPWLAETGKVESLHSGRTFHLTRKKLALRFFFAVVTVVFAMLTISYAERMAYEVWRPLPETWLLWSNAVVLVFGSITFQRAVICARNERSQELNHALYAAGGLTLLFLGGQVLAWTQLQAVDNLAPNNPANVFFYLITALHGLHLLGGLAVWAGTVAKLHRFTGPTDSLDFIRIGRSVELCAAYWHFLLIIWLALFGLLFFPGGSLPILCRAF